MFRTKKMAKEKAEVSTTIANILGDAIVPGMFNLGKAVANQIGIHKSWTFQRFYKIKRLIFLFNILSR